MGSKTRRKVRARQVQAHSPNPEEKMLRAPGAQNRAILHRTLKESTGAWAIPRPDAEMDGTSEGNERQDGNPRKRAEKDCGLDMGDSDGAGEASLHDGHPTSPHIRSTCLARSHNKGEGTAASGKVGAEQEPQSGLRSLQGYAHQLPRSNIACGTHGPLS